MQTLTLPYNNHILYTRTTGPLTGLKLGLCLYMHSSRPASQHPEPLYLHPPSPPHIKGHQSPTVQGERQIFREGLSPHKSVEGEREREHDTHPTPPNLHPHHHRPSP